MASSYICIKIIFTARKKNYLKIKFEIGGKLYLMFSVGGKRETISKECDYLLTQQYPQESKGEKMICTGAGSAFNLSLNVQPTRWF